jgi:ATP phosphoribosyltransferase regulatory subunit
MRMMNKHLGGNPDEFSSVLKRMYSECGYSHYRTVGFEEYDLFSAYRDFLTSGQMITFTGAGGRLLALKPDITMSIIRDASQMSGRSDKFFYSESVYRVPAGGDEFKEILQIGLECIGDICQYDRAEVVSLACRTLNCTGCDYMIDISHTGLIDGIYKSFGISERFKADIAAALKDKNAPGLSSICSAAGIKENDIKKLIDLSRMSMPIKQAKAALEELGFLRYMESADAIKELDMIAKTLTDDEADRVRLDLSVVHGINYYDGIVFNGYICGVSEAILKGGEYGKLVTMMGHTGSGLGFALYTDLLESLDRATVKYAADVLLVCGNCDPVIVANKVRDLKNEGKTVLVQKSAVGIERCKTCIRMCSGEA